MKLDMIAGSSHQPALDVDERALALDHLDVGAIRRRLRSDVVGTHIYIFNDVPCTNRVLCTLAESGEREGTVVLAEAQDAGRGRRGKTWFSPPGVNLHA